MEEVSLETSVIKIIRKVSVGLAFIIALYGASFYILKGVPDPLLKFYLLLALLILTSGTVKLFGITVDNYVKKYEKTQASFVAFILSFRNLINILIYLTAAILALGVLGIEVTPLVASLGIGGLAIALALQKTLENYFSGVYLTATKSIKVGDYIELESGLRGYVHEVGWRATKIRMLPNNIVVVPNAKLADSVLVNYYMPQQEMSVVLQCGVSYLSDLEHVEKVTIEVAKKVLQSVEGGKKDFEPFIRYHTFGDSNIQFSIILRVEEFVNQYLVVHEFFKALTKRYKKEGIEISWPIRKIYSYPTE